MRTRFVAAMLAAVLLGNAVHAQTVPVPAPDALPDGTPPPAVVQVPGPRGFTPPPITPATVTPTLPAVPVSVGGATTHATPSVEPPLPPPPPGDRPVGTDHTGVNPTTGAMAGRPAEPSASGVAAWPVQATTPGRRPSLIRERLRLLDGTIIPLAERSHSARIVEGILGLAVGGALVALGFALQPSSGTDTVGLNALLWLTGGYSMLGGGIQLAWVPARERLAEQYESMPRATAADRRAQMHFGESALDDMAADGARRRVVSAVSNVGLALATLAVIYRQQIFNGAPMPDPPAWNYLIIGVTGISVITSLVGLMGQSQEERMRDTYRRELTMLRQEPITGD